VCPVDVPPRPPACTAGLRTATPGDAAPVAAIWLAAGTQAWSSFLSAQVLAGEGTVARWLQRIATLQEAQGEVMVLACDADGPVGFAWVVPARGELEALYTHPRVWGAGYGRLLLGVAEDHLRRHGVASATLWTEERNTRARAVYERAGWQPDGGVRERLYAGTPLRELRHRKAL
jgi:GNAT superfamily N-acetyltransferase